MDGIGLEYLKIVTGRFQSIKSTAEKAIEQLDDTQLHWYPNGESNSIAVIMKHMSGNMKSRWTDFFSSDGEKSDRNRDNEFKNDLENRQQLSEIWNDGWECLLDTIEDIEEDDLVETVFIRGEPHTVIEAIDRQIYHYSYHVGQIVYIAKQLQSEKWKTLTIPRQ